MASLISNHIHTMSAEEQQLTEEAEVAKEEMEDNSGDDTEEADDDGGILYSVVFSHILFPCMLRWRWWRRKDYCG